MENNLKKRAIQRKRRSFRVRKAVKGTSQKPRLHVFRSNRHLSAQIIDDENHSTLLSLGTLSKSFSGTEMAKKSKASAKEIGRQIAIAAKEKNIQAVVFDRGRYKYHGIIAELADAARAEGLRF